MTYQPHYCESESRGLLIAPKPSHADFLQHERKGAKLGPAAGGVALY